MLETVQFIYQNPGQTLGLMGCVTACYVVATWLRTTPDQPAIQIPDDITIRFEHYHFYLTGDNLPDD